MGIFYTTFTQFLGFEKYGDEFKVMGLAAFGKPVHCDKLQDVIYMTSNGLFKLNEKYFRHPNEGVKMIWENGVPEIDPIYSDFLVEQFGKSRAKDQELKQFHKYMAASVQEVCLYIIIAMQIEAHKRTGLDNLCLKGV